MTLSSTDKHCSCGCLTAKINGRTFKDALRVTGTNHVQRSKIRATEWVTVCPICDAYALGAEFTHPWPFLCQDGVMRTVTDFDHKTKTESGSEVLDFATFRFSGSALDSAEELVGIEDPSTIDVEAQGSAFLTAPSPPSALAFSEAVCKWGRSKRVYANLLRHNPGDQLAQRLHNWLVSVPANSFDEAIKGGTAIKGLGVSFASKHLRMLQPDRFPVLDDVLQSGLGFATNTAGFRLFTHLLEEFCTRYGRTESLGLLESGIFLLVRQNVRSVN
jgi:hypothetical protein